MIKRRNNGTSRASVFCNFQHTQLPACGKSKITIGISDFSVGNFLRALVFTSQLLILDEPTNHLDLDSIAAIESALASDDGALLVASHDEDFLVALGVTRRMALPGRR